MVPAVQNVFLEIRLVQLSEIAAQKKICAFVSTNALQERFQKMQMLKTFEVDLQALRCFLHTCFYAVTCTGTGSL